MQLNMQGQSSGALSELANNSSDDSQMVVSLRKMMKELEVMVVHTVRRVIRPGVEDLMTKVVKKDIQSALEKFFADWNRRDFTILVTRLSEDLTRNYAGEIVTSRERVLQLQFMDEVSSTVLTGKAIESKEGTPIRVTLLDETTGHDVRDRPEASAKVEILVLEASTDDNECDWSLEDFNNRIISDNDKKKPHFTKSQYVYLKDGTGVLSDIKLGHDAKWTKICHCRLGARIVGNYLGVKVKEARSGSFMVRDRRGDCYKKRYPPLLSDELWRLKSIGKDGLPIRRLNEAKIFVVQDFLFLYHIDAQKLEQIAGVHGKMWDATVSHAQTCVIDDKRICLSYPSSGEGVVFDVVGRLKGIIRDSHYVPVDNLSGAEKASQHNLLLSAFENWKDNVTYFEDETSLVNQFPFSSSEIANKNESTLSADSLGLDHYFENFGVDHSFGRCNSLSVSHGLDHYFGLDLSFDGINSFHDSLVLDHNFENFGMDRSFGRSNSLSDSLSFHHTFEDIGVDRSFGESNIPSGSILPQAHSCQQSSAGRNYGVSALALMLWVSRAKVRVRSQGYCRASKKQKIV